MYLWRARKKANFLNMILSEGGRYKGIIPTRAKTRVDKKKLREKRLSPFSKKLLPGRSAEQLRLGLLKKELPCLLLAIVSVWGPAKGK